MKKLIFHFDQPRSTIIEINNSRQYFSLNDIDNDFLFLEPKLFPLRLMQIVNRENLSNTIFNEIIFVFNGILSKESSVILNNNILDQISYKESYKKFNLKKAFTPYIISNDKIKLISHIDFYMAITKVLNKNNYPSIIIYDGTTVDIELKVDKSLSLDMNADIKLLIR